MYRLIRNLHLISGLTFFFMALVFALSSLVIIYRPLLPEAWREAERRVAISSVDAESARTLALTLMRNHDLAGDLRQVRETDDVIEFRIVRPGMIAEITYDRSSKQATIESQRHGFLEMLVQLHVNHGFWHSFLPSNVWSLLSLLASTGLLLLGLTGLYLWFRQHSERFVGGVLVSVALLYALTALVLSRL